MRRNNSWDAGRRRLYGLAMVFTLTPPSSGFTIRDGRLTEMCLQTGDYPLIAAIWFVVGLSL